jgi:hypothetical protein
MLIPIVSNSAVFTIALRYTRVSVWLFTEDDSSFTVKRSFFGESFISEKFDTSSHYSLSKLYLETISPIT